MFLFLENRRGLWTAVKGTSKNIDFKIQNCHFPVKKRRQEYVSKLKIWIVCGSNLNKKITKKHKIVKFLPFLAKVKVAPGIEGPS